MKVSKLIIFAFRLTKAGYPSQCAWLQGTLITAKDETARKIDSIPFDYVLPDGPSNKKNNGTNSKSNGKETKSKLDEYREGLRDYQNGQIAKLGKNFNNSNEHLNQTQSLINFRSGRR